MWNFVFYIGYLMKKEHTEYNGLETYVSKKLKN